MVDVTKLRQLYQGNARARALLDALRRRKEYEPETCVERLPGGAVPRSFGRAQLISVFLALEEIGCGMFIYGRKGRPSRFAWAVDLVSVARVASGRDDQVIELHPDDRVPRWRNYKTWPEDQLEVATADGCLRHTFHLRPGLRVQLELPADLTPSEGKRLARFVGSLSFQG